MLNQQLAQILHVQQRRLCYQMLNNVVPKLCTCVLEYYVSISVGNTSRIVRQYQLHIPRVCGACRCASDCGNDAEVSEVMHTQKWGAGLIVTAMV